ncbi:hypothetical protein BLA17378_03365 [Burkholderia aenigmatica]|uniref:Uncharacterized protein n=1 Tax=Burkholderia aenigmatica TaxID=2015348 RepID=A0ABY6XWR8_9BURK|nr:hypothetical protein BLA17378_03365 [Burkholderia aenigmatica]VWD27010.1 hypothetical protein BLA18628_04327 [Burkholderia aenigmatica]
MRRSAKHSGNRCIGIGGGAPRCRKKKLPPREFEALLDEKHLAKLQVLCDTCNMNARVGLGRWAALTFDPCRGDLACWLIEQSTYVAVADACGTRRCLFASVVVAHRAVHCARARSRSSPPVCLAAACQLRAFQVVSRSRICHRPATACLPDYSRLPAITGNHHPTNINRHPHFGRCHCPTISLRLTAGHRGRMSSEQMDGPAIPCRTQPMPARLTDTASAYDDVRRVR